MHWRIKGVVQKTLSALPGGVEVNDFLQQCVGGARNLRAHIESKVLDDWVVLAGHMRELGVPLEGRRYLEVGTGWFPTLPTCYALAGAESCVTFDLMRHLDHKRTRRMVEFLEPLLPEIARASGQALDRVEARYEELRGARDGLDLLRRARIDYQAPADAASTGLPDNSVDVVFSNSVLEHVPGPDILRIMREAQRVLKPGGFAIHSVNCGDHYAYFDRRITPINYLTYPESRWTFWNNDLLYQNRLRPQDFVSLAEEAGLALVIRKCKPRQALLDLLPHLNLAPEFRGYPPEELCATSIDFVSCKPEMAQAT